LAAGAGAGVGAGTVRRVSDGDHQFLYLGEEWDDDKEEEGRREKVPFRVS